MSDTFNHLSRDEKLKAENEFLKMKLMLEQGASFASFTENGDLPIGIENEFLTNVATFEKNFAERKTIKIFDKIMRPTNFKPVAEIGDTEIENEYQLLRAHLQKHNINMDVCSPNITTRELYRFVTEELFEHEADDLNMPGWTTNFIYDEFYPDPIYDNTQVAVDYCIRPILAKYAMDWTHHLHKEGTDLNNHTGLSRKDFQELMQRFQDAYTTLELSEITDPHCRIEEGICTVSGSYQLAATIDKEAIEIAGTWIVKMKQGGEWNYWDITSVTIGNINF